MKLNFSSSALFYMKTRICLKYFVNDWSLTTPNFEINGLFYLIFSEVKKIVYNFE